MLSPQLSLQVMGANLIHRLDNTKDTHAADVLAPCKYNTTPLHIFLMHTLFSPLANSWLSRFVGAYDIVITKQSVADEALNMVSRACLYNSYCSGYSSSCGPW